MNKSKKILEVLGKNITEKSWKYYSEKVGKIEQEVINLGKDIEEEVGPEIEVVLGALNDLKLKMSELY
jgi:hypothetical protein